MGVSFPCGQCLPCRINRRRVWTNRIYLESLMHKQNSFVTLTYNRESLPENGRLVPKDLTLWLKKLRNYLAPSVVRYYGVGEYGDESFRPHYHILLFGYGPCLRNGTWGVRGYDKKMCECIQCQLVHRAWMKGRISVDRCEPESIQYVCGYVVKKMTKGDDKRLGGRPPEFCRMSRNPGIGYGYVDWFVKNVLLPNKKAMEDVVITGDVPQFLIQGKSKKLIFGRYLLRKIREAVLKNDGKEPPNTVHQKEKALQALLETQKAFSQIDSERREASRRSITEKGVRLQKVANITSRFKINQKRKKLDG